MLHESYLNDIRAFAEAKKLHYSYEYLYDDQHFDIYMDLYFRSEKKLEDYSYRLVLRGASKTIEDQIFDMQNNLLAWLGDTHDDVQGTNQVTYTIIVRYKNSGETCEKFNNVMDFHIDDHICTINISEDERAVIPLCNVLKISSVVNKEEK